MIILRDAYKTRWILDYSILSNTTSIMGCFIVGPFSATLAQR